MRKSLLLLGILFLFQSHSLMETKRWGFFAHRLVNRMAVYTLPPPLSRYFKEHIEYLAEHSTAPDHRRYAVEYEAPRHYMDMDRYPDSLLSQMPVPDTVFSDLLGKEYLQEHGILPWNIQLYCHLLRNAFRSGDGTKILKMAAELGHYVADSHVPLHTSSNYNGQLTGQTGLHAFWESRLPELFSEEYELLSGRANYIDDTRSTSWESILDAHAAVDSVLQLEKELQDSLGTDLKYSFEKRGKAFIRTESREYSRAYHEMLNGMVERQLIRSIRLTGSLWYTCWVDAGMPDLPLGKKEPKLVKFRKRKQESARDH